MILSSIVAIVSLTGVLLVAKGFRIGWAWGMGAQFVWVAYSIMIAQYGLLIMPPFYLVVNYIGWRNSRKAES